MSIFSIALLALYLTGIVGMIRQFKEVETRSKFKGDPYYKFGYVLSSIFWPIIAILVFKSVIKELKQSKE